LIRLFAAIAEADVKNEIEAIEKLCSRGHRNIVEVLGHFALPNPLYYAIDMELCEITLGDFIEGERNLVQEAWKETLEGYDCANEPTRRWLGISQILLEITKGLSFIHESGYVHRDSKPSNGAFPMRTILMGQCSTQATQKDGRLQILGLAARAHPGM
jgi:serine/threonine protein kinase